MPRYSTTEQRTGQRYLASLMVRAEWDDADGGHIVAEGTTENVGPEGALYICRTSCRMSAAACNWPCWTKRDKSCNCVSSPKSCAWSAIRDTL